MLLVSAGCTEVQGYLFSPAVPSGEVAGLLGAIADDAAAGLSNSARRWDGRIRLLAQACATATAHCPQICQQCHPTVRVCNRGNSIPWTAQDTHVQIARLREQVETLMKDRVTPALADAAGRAESAIYDAADVVRDQADAMSGKVREQPLMAIADRAGIGYVLGRTIR